MASFVASSLEVKDEAGTSSVESHSVPAEEIELHCWKCRNPFTDMKCQDCPRTFHTKCFENLYPTSVKDTGEYVELNNHSRLIHLASCFRKFKVITCGECLVSATSDAILSQSSQEEQRDNLLTILDIIPRKYDYFDDLSELKGVSYKVDLKTIKKNILENKYRSARGILADIKFILHNIAVYQDHYEALPYSEILQGAKNLSEDCITIITDYENCPDCFMRMNISKSQDVQVAVCTKPHLVVWVKVGTFRWPAIVVGIDLKREKNAVDVIYFGNKKFDRKFQAELKHCLLYTDRNRISDKTRNAVETCNDYIKALTAKFGAVVLPPKNAEVSLGPNMEDQIGRMFPGFARTSAGSSSSN